jgi:hypothetical protein
LLRLSDFIPTLGFKEKVFMDPGNSRGEKEDVVRQAGDGRNQTKTSALPTIEKTLLSSIMTVRIRVPGNCREVKRCMAALKNRPFFSLSQRTLNNQGFHHRRMRCLTQSVKNLCA